RRRQSRTPGGLKKKPLAAQISLLMPRPPKPNRPTVAGGCRFSRQRRSRPGDAHHNKEIKMPKQKTHSGAKKRFKVTGSGKLMKQQAGMRHNLEVKASKRKRRLNADQVLSAGDVKQAKKLLVR